MNELIEKLAELEHNQWCHWTKYFLSMGTKENENRWREQMRTLYSELSEEEKNSDRAWAKEVLKIVFDLLDTIEPKVRGYVAERVFETMQGSQDRISVEEIMERFRDEVKKIKNDNPIQNIKETSSKQSLGESEVSNNQHQVEGSEATSVSLAGQNDDSALSNIQLIKLKLLCRIRGLQTDIDNGYGEFYKGAKFELEELLRHLEKREYIYEDIECAWKYLGSEERRLYKEIRKSKGESVDEN